jgi:serine/threonine-protein kinase
VRDFASDGPLAYFVMEFVEGATLEHSLRTDGRIAIERAMSIIGQTAEALDYAHNRGVIHRDIKPANIMITGDGVVKVADFGTAKMLDAAGTQLTLAGSILGSPHYMAPEQVTESGVDGRSDQFSLAVIAYEMLAGRKPFEGDFAPAVLYQIVSEPAPPLLSIRPELCAEVDGVLQKALAKNPAERYASCGEFVRALKTALGQTMLVPGPVENGAGWRTRLRRWLTFWN